MLTSEASDPDPIDLAMDFCVDYSIGEVVLGNIFVKFFFSVAKYLFVLSIEKVDLKKKNLFT